MLSLGGPTFKKNTLTLYLGVRTFITRDHVWHSIKSECQTRCPKLMRKSQFCFLVLYVVQFVDYIQQFLKKGFAYIHQPIHLPIQPSISLPIQPSVGLPIQPSVCLPIQPSARPSIQPSVGLPIQPYVCLSVRLPIHLSFYLIPLGIHSICFNHPSLNFMHSVNYIN